MSNNLNNIKCMVLFSGDVVGNKMHGAVLTAQVESIDGDKMTFVIPDSGMPDVEESKFIVGPADSVIGLVLKVSASSIMLEVIHDADDVQPKMCCYCGVVKVCAWKCWC